MEDPTSNFETNNFNNNIKFNSKRNQRFSLNDKSGGV